MRAALPTLIVLALLGCGKDTAAPDGPIDAGAPVVPQAPSAVGQLETPTGQVTLERAGGSRAATAEPLYFKDVIDTGEEGSAILRFSGDRVVELGPGGRFEVLQEGTGVALNVTQGFVLTRVKATPTQEAGQVLLTISTPFGLTRVGSAELSLKVNGETAAVDVKLGEIELVTREGKVSKVTAGMQGALGTARELPPLPIMIISSQGAAEIKAKDAKNFTAVNPKRLPPLKVGDLVRVKNGRFTLGLEGSPSSVSLLKGTEVVIGEGRKGPGQEASALEVTKGELEVAAGRGQVTRLGVAPGITLVSDLGGQYSLRRTGSGFAVEAFAGDVKVERDSGEKELIPGGQSATVPFKGPTVVTPSTRETVALPARGVRLFHSGLRKLAFSWEGDGSTTAWRVQLANDSAFSDVVRDGEVHETYFNVPVLPKGAWYWRVFKSGSDTEHARGQVLFAPEPKAHDLSRLKNIVPDGAETTTIYFQDKDKPPVVTFTWAAVEGASKYAVKVYRDGQLASPVAERTVAEDQVSLPENTLVEGKYLWSLTPLDAGGNELKGGRMNKLLMTFDNAVASLLIKSPRNGDAGGREVKAAGVAPVGSRLFINGKSVALDEQARFDVMVPPLPGGRVVFRLINGGVESWTIRTVRAR